MKIAFITLHRVRNYGSSLQTLATQHYLESQGSETEVIDYYQERYTSFGLLKRLKNKSTVLKKNPVLCLAARMVISVSYLKKKLVFDSFLKKYIHLTPKTYRTEAELIEGCPKADAYCTGSDQVWNSHWNEGIDAPLYLSFVPSDKYKFSYASSIGNAKIDQSEIDAITPYLREYKKISVRENTGVDILSSMGFENIQQMLDPTLLYSKEWWNLYTSNKFSDKKYVVTYNLHHDPKIDIYANKLAKQKKLKVYNISYNWHDIVKKGKLKWCPTVEEYLGLIRDAQYIVTDSFHATVFSLIFEKQFIDIFPDEASSRLRSLLELTETEGRGFDGMPSIDEADKVIDYNLVEKKLNDERKKAEDYIKEVIREINR